MMALIRACIRILTFRAGGEAMPYSQPLLGALLLVTFALDAVLSLNLPGIETSPLWILVRMGIALGLLWLLMQGAGKAERFVQTATALTLSTLAFAIVTAPILLAIWPIPKDPGQMTALQALFMLVLMPLTFWLLCVRAWIFHGATEYRWLLAFLASIALLVAEATLTAFLIKAFK